MTPNEQISSDHDPIADLNLTLQRDQYCLTLGEALEEITRKLRGMPEVIRVILFGSYAEGRRDLFTDLDLIVVMETDQNPLQRTAELYPKLQAGIDLDLLIYTPDEFERMKDQGFLRHALGNGRVIYEKNPA